MEDDTLASNSQPEINRADRDGASKAEDRQGVSRSEPLLQSFATCAGEGDHRGNARHACPFPAIQGCAGKARLIHRIPIAGQRRDPPAEANYRFADAPLRAVLNLQKIKGPKSEVFGGNNGGRRIIGDRRRRRSPPRERQAQNQREDRCHTNYLATGVSPLQELLEGIQSEVFRFHDEANAFRISGVQYAAAVGAGSPVTDLISLPLRPTR